MSKELPCGHVKIGIPCHEYVPFLFTFNELCGVRACHPDGVLCFEQVEAQVDGCKFGHKYTIRCHASERFRKDPENCTTLVDVDMPKCGHSMQISCCKRQKALENPTYCKAVCGVMLPCGHPCAARCGKCIEKTRKANPKFEMCQEKRKELQHLPCDTRCNQLLLCGHKCREPCHKGNSSLLGKAKPFMQVRSVVTVCSLAQLRAVILPEAARRNALSCATHVPRVVNGSVPMKGNAPCLVGRLVLGFLVTDVARRCCPVTVDVPPYVARNAPARTTVYSMGQNLLRKWYSLNSFLSV